MKHLCDLQNIITGEIVFTGNFLFSPDTFLITDTIYQHPSFQEDVNSFLYQKSRIIQTDYALDTKVCKELCIDPRCFGRVSEDLPVLYAMNHDFHSPLSGCDDPYILTPREDFLYSMAGWNLHIGPIYIWRHGNVPNEIR